MELGYHLLLEKPMATSLQECIEIDRARQKTNRIVAVCHSMRHIRAYEKIKSILDSGVLGRLISIDQLEGVAPTHQAHSFVRGNWANESRSAFMLLAKSCHDLDYISWLMGENAVRVSSFGTLTHFVKQNRPEGAPDRCVQGCPVGDSCPYNAEKHYRDGKGYGSWIGLDEWTPEQREKFLWESHYGRCAYDMDNDVVDHQVVAMEFPSAATGTFTMTAFAPHGRRIRVCGTRGFLEALPDQHVIDVYHFEARNDCHERFTVEEQQGSHGGGDENLLEHFVEAVRRNDPNHVLTGTAESLRSHAVVFAAEMARRSKRVVELKNGLPVA
jgi:predicted dehydrogenase